MSAGFDALKIKNINLAIEASERKRVLQIDQITASRKEVHPGDSVELTVTFTGENGVEMHQDRSLHGARRRASRHAEFHRRRRQLFEPAGLSATGLPRFRNRRRSWSRS